MPLPTPTGDIVLKSVLVATDFSDASQKAQRHALAIAAEIARVVKANSSRWAKEKWNLRFALQTGYGAFSVSESNVAAVSKYIATQREHHRNHTFRDEYLAFLKKNKIEFDERYIWT